MGRKRTNKDDIISAAKQFFELNQRSPYWHEVGYSSTAIKNYWNSFNDMLKECGLPLNKIYHNLKTKSDGISYLKYLFKKLNKVPSSLDVKRDGVNKDWFAKVFGSFHIALFESGLIDTVVETTKEGRANLAIKGLLALSEQLGKCPTVDEYDRYAKENKLVQRRNVENLLGMKYADICVKYVGGANQLKKSKQQLYEDLLELKIKLGRSPMSAELKQYNLSSLQQYQREFGMTYNKIIESFGWEISGHSFTDKTDEELLQDYLQLYNRLKRIPLAEDINKQDNMASHSTYKKRLGGIIRVCELLKIDFVAEMSKNKMGEGQIFFDRNKELCRSYPELVISNILIDNGIDFEKEYPYKKVISTDRTKRTFDWKLTAHNVYVEYFGMYDEKHRNKNNKYGSYTNKTLIKIGDCNKHNVELVSIFPEDLDNNYEGFVQKLKNRGVEVSIINSYENVYKKVI